MTSSAIRVTLIAALLAFVAGMVFATFSEMRVFLPALLNGAVVTLQVSALSILVFVTVALLAGIGRASKIAPLRWFCAVYVEIFRGTSLLVQLFWLFFVLPEFGITLSPMAAGVTAIGLNYGAYGAEIVRGAIGSVPKGQIEAGIALNMPEFKRMTRIVLPQAVLIMLPGMGNQTIELIKSTALVSAVTLVDITYASVLQNNIHYRTIEIFTVTMLLYYILSQLVRFGISALEARASRYRAREV